MAVAFRSIDRRLSNDVHQLHDALWSPGWKGDREKLRKALVKDATDLDAFLKAGGKLRRQAEQLAKEWGKEDGAGESLFELLEHTFYLTGASEYIRRGDYKRAGEYVAEAVESMSIGTCVAADSFHIVQEWEGGKIDFEAYTSKLADILQAKGVARAGDFKRILLAARGYGKPFDDKAPGAEQALGATAALANGAWLALSTISVRKAIGGTLMLPYDDYAAVIEKVVSRI